VNTSHPVLASEPIIAKLYRWMPPHPTFFVRRSVYERCGNFNLSLGTARDYETDITITVEASGIDGLYS